MGMTILGPIVLLLITLFMVTYTILIERRILALMQNRKGPNRVGWQGCLQTVADVFKLLIKEDIIPSKADRFIFKVAPIVTFVPAFAVMAVLPFTDKIKFSDLGVGLLYYIAVSSISIIGVMLGGWASNNKYALLGGMRSVAQMISYEVVLVMSVLGVVMTSQSINLQDIVMNQREVWFIFPQFLGFVLFVIAATAELTRTPFDLPEAESELVAGYHVEYTGFRFAFFMLSEYVYMLAMSALITILYLGGWNAPLGFTFIPPIVHFLIKLFLVVFFFIWLRATFPRFRIDQLMELAWKVLLPLAICNLLLTALLKEVPFLKDFY